MNRTSWSCVPDPLPCSTRASTPPIGPRQMPPGPVDGRPEVARGKFCARRLMAPSPLARHVMPRRRAPTNAAPRPELSELGLSTSSELSIGGSARTSYGELVTRAVITSRSAGDVPSQSATRSTAQRHMTAWWRRNVVWGAFDLARAGRTTERRARTVARDQMECLRRIKRRRSRLAHMCYLATTLHPGRRRRRSASVTLLTP